MDPNYASAVVQVAADQLYPSPAQYSHSWRQEELCRTRFSTLLRNRMGVFTWQCELEDHHKVIDRLDTQLCCPPYHIVLTGRRVKWQSGTRLTAARKNSCEPHRLIRQI